MPNEHDPERGTSELTERDIPLLRDLIGTTLAMRASMLHLHGAIRLLNVPPRPEVQASLDAFVEHDKGAHDWMRGMLDDYKRLINGGDNAE